MYPHVTQFETRDQLIRDELQVREERHLARRPSPRTRRATVLPIRLARIMKLADPRHRPGPEPPPQTHGSVGGSAERVATRVESLIVARGGLDNADAFSEAAREYGRVG